MAMGDSDQRVRVWIELEPGTEPVCGTIYVAAGEPREFVGWMELAHAIDHARLARPGGDGNDGRGGPPGG